MYRQTSVCHTAPPIPSHPRETVALLLEMEHTNRMAVISSVRHSLQVSVLLIESCSMLISACVVIYSGNVSFNSCRFAQLNVYL